MTKLPNGTYLAHYKPPGQKRLWKRAKSIEQAQAWVAEQRYLAGHGARVTRSMTTGEWLQEWLQEVATSAKRGSTVQRAPNTLRGYRLHVDRYLRSLSAIPLGKLSPDDIQRLEQDLREGRARGLDGQPIRLSGRTLVHVHRTLKAALGAARRRDLIYSNPVDAVPTPGISTEETFQAHTLSLKEIKALISAAEHYPNGAAVILAAGTGMRRGEVLGLHWSDVHLEDPDPWLRVRYSAQPIKGRGMVDLPTKTAKSERDLILPRVVVEAVRAHRAEQQTLGIPTNGHVFVSPRLNGEPMAAAYLYRFVWVPIRDRAGLSPAVRFHDLRHSLATNQHLASSVPIAALSAYLGHSTTATTLGTYVHAGKADTRAIADWIDGAMTVV